MTTHISDPTDPNYDRPAPDEKVDPNADLIGMELAAGNLGAYLIVEGTATDLPQYMNCSLHLRSGEKLSDTMRPAALIRRHKELMG